VSAHSAPSPAPPGPLTRRSHGRGAAPVAAAHLGLGSFFRAHQAVYTELAPDADAWGIAAFTGRSAGLAEQLTAQDGLYTLLEQRPDGASCQVVSTVSVARPGGDLEGWLDVLSATSTRLVTLTVTEAAYRRSKDGDVRLDDADVVADVAALRAGHRTEVRTVPGRLLAGLGARYAADAGPLAVVPCDNLLHNGAAVARVVTRLADEVDQGLAAWVREEVAFVDSEVDRITPRTTDDDRRVVEQVMGVVDACPVVTEPFSEWVLSGRFPAGRPLWEHAGAQFVDDVTPFEQRKLWLLNGAHSQLAYLGSILGHTTVRDAVADDRCRGWVEQWWDEAAAHLDLPEHSVRAYRDALAERFANPGIRHLLEQIAADGSQKLPVRLLPVLRAERASGRVPPAATRTLAAWVAHLRGAGAPVQDPLAPELGRRAAGALPDGVRRVLEVLDPALAADTDLVAAVTATAEELERR
jgi:fructuronate reductase